MLSNYFVKSIILVIDDEPEVLELVGFNLQQSGFSVATANNGRDGLTKARTISPSLIVLDVMMPEMDGLEVCKALRRDAATAPIPIIILTARASEIDRVLGLELGADDYVTKPFSPRELVLRVKKLIERERPLVTDEDTFRFGDLSVDVPRFRVSWCGKPIELTATEFKLLTVLIQRRGRVQSREQLLHDVWEYDTHVDSRTVDTHVRRLREKLGPAASFVDTVRGLGYRFLSEQG